MTPAYDQCIRCGKTTGWGQAVCRDCNPAGLPEPSPSQYHATVFLTVLVVLAIFVVVLLLRTVVVGPAQPRSALARRHRGDSRRHSGAGRFAGWLERAARVGRSPRANIGDPGLVLPAAG